VAGLGGLWPGYVSPAHRALVDPATYHPPLTGQDLSRGWIYSKVFYNNLGTNFAVSQVCDVLFRYAISSSSGMLSDSRAAAFGWEAVTPFHQIFTGGKPRTGSLPASASLVEVDNPAVVLLALKKAEDGSGYVLRLWNMEGTAQTVRLHFPNLRLQSAWFSDLAETKLVEIEIPDETSLFLTVGAGEIITIRVQLF
jgi:alpha-mannosidase